MLLAHVARGAAATAVMSLSFLARPGLAPPPQEIALNVARRAGIRADAAPGALKHPYWIGAHFGFGMALAAAHALLPRPRRGAVFGIAAWLANYGIALPLFRLYPRVDRDDHVRAVAGFAAHVVYGAVLGESRARTRARR